jgi:hypothetical protein
MILPIRMIWNLQIPRAQKQSIGGIFGVGVICIVAAIVRVIQIGVKSRSNSTPSSSWLALWAMIEAAIGTSRFGLALESTLTRFNFAAIIIGCLPSFAVMYRTAMNTRSGYSQNRYYEDRDDHNSGHPSTDRRSKSVPLSNMSTASHTIAHGHASTWGPDNTKISSSQEELAKPGHITVTRSVQIEYEQ